jgi:excinuclease ABC subunit C
MLDGKGLLLYVGKAKNLKKRVTSYFRRALDTKTQQLVKQIKSIEVTVTRNEREALLLENNLIKELQPRYNVIFRDDKSYPYLKLTVDAVFSRLSFHRGPRGDGKIYGPYPSVREARVALNLLQSIFRLRQCDEVFFRNRTRPCLQYQIKRCSAPCVGYITSENYRKDVELTRLFLEGKNKNVIEKLIHQMTEASIAKAFEQAARIRDQIALLRTIQEHQIIMGNMKDVDVLGIYAEGNAACVHVLVIREGRMLGSRQYFPNKTALILQEEDMSQILLEAFILQHYQTDIPKTILLPFALNNSESVSALLHERRGGPVNIATAVKGDRLRWVKMAVTSARLALISRVKQTRDLTPRFLALQESLQLESIPEKLACFDASHTLGEATVVSCVVFDVNGPHKSEYRRFNVRAKTGGDDYAALKEGLTRHFTRLKSESKGLPDVLLVDGGKGQLNIAKAVLEECQAQGVILLGVAKGPERKAGLETVYLSSNGKIIQLQPNAAALLLIQQIRDEAHRFAITAHRKRIAHLRSTSTLEKVSGIGSKRRQNLLQHFGGLSEIMQASIEELGKAPGINQGLAERLYEVLHGH